MSGPSLQHRRSVPYSARVELSKRFRLDPNSVAVSVCEPVAHLRPAQAIRLRGGLHQELNDELSTFATLSSSVRHVALGFALCFCPSIFSRSYVSRLVLKARVASENNRDDCSVILVQEEARELVPVAMCQFNRLAVRQGAVMSANTPQQSHLDKMEPLLSIVGAASFLGISRRQVYTLLERGELPHVRVGQRTRFIPADLRSYLERHREAGP
jgi:excisionase family DNA binding protein